MADNGTDLRSVLRHFAPGILSLFLSVGVHAGVAAPYLVSHLLRDPSAIGEDIEDEGPLGDGLIGDGRPPPTMAMLTPIAPVQVSIYTPPPPVPTPEAPAAEEAPSETPPTETVTQPQSNRTSQGVASEQERPRGKVDSEAEKPGSPDNSGVVGQAPSGERRPCEETEGITQVSGVKWKVPRDVIDYYASHLRQLDKQAGTATARGKEGVPIGVRVYLPRCSVLRQVGLRNKDIILSINDRPVATLPQAIKTWLGLRNERNFTVVIRRKNVGLVTHQYRITH
ncbi:MAG: hypothetical protein ACI8S6_001105 [Myxococcota bacterium]